ncbi:P-loop containing nucleoside triphosphate hydrolase [Parasponia andersonii]|uniref:P-loop containing nucleoside triphosphate hydrolase n=1 Tax=Parasponia andersonii TaxID=3476 RepID=A0A2P5D4H5_PARAD|nr:P-loop containing nucleoside triphosphate hydrolase [Parasponia andersonii]
MGMFAMLAAAALAGGLMRYYFGGQDEDANSPPSKPSQGSDTRWQNSHHHDHRVKSSSSNHFEGSGYEKSDYPYSTSSTHKSTSSSTTTSKASSISKSSSTDSPKLSTTPNKPTSYAQKNNEVRVDLDIQRSWEQLVNSLSSSSSSASSSSSLNRSSNSSKPQSSVINPSTSNSVKAATSLYKAPSSSSSGSNPSSQKHTPILKPSLLSRQGKGGYVLEENGTLPLYIIPEDVKDLIKNSIVPEVLNKTLSPSRYKDYFSALLYAEDYYYEKWSDYKLLNVTLDLHEAAVYKKSDHRNKSKNENEEKDDKIFVAFKMDAIPERRPFLLSRDLVYARPSGSNVEPFQGTIYRVVKSNLVLVDFNDKFHSQHYPTRRYDISFSFNRVSLKRAHQALNSISDSLFENFLFPNSLTRKTTNAPPTLSPSPILDREISTTIRRISAVQSSPPYLISGPRCTSESKSASHLRKPSRTGEIIRESVIQIYRTSPNCRILICSPSNSACDVLMRGLKKSIPETAMFRANAAFREREDVPDDILPSCLIREECFACPPLQKLREFKVIFSTFVSCFRLHSEGLPVGHFSHVFMVDASFAIEPEAMVVLANFAGENTAVIAAGEAGCSPNWVRSEIGRRNGLKVSYFERLRKFRPYQGDSPEFITDLDRKRDALYM